MPADKRGLHGAIRLDNAQGEQRRRQWLAKIPNLRVLPKMPIMDAKWHYRANHGEPSSRREGVSICREGAGREGRIGHQATIVIGLGRNDSRGHSGGGSRVRA